MLDIRTWWAERAGKAKRAGKRGAKRRPADEGKDFLGLDALEQRQLLSATAIGSVDDVLLENPGDTYIFDPTTFFDETDTVVKFSLPESFAASSEFNSTKTSLFVQLRDGIAPQTVANFLNYMTSGRYNDPTNGNTIIHRSVRNFVVQGGGFTFDGTDLIEVPTDPPVVNEFNTSNLRGTMAMAKLGSNPNSATSQWFFNLANNSANLDNQNGGFTVFADVLFDGMEVVDAIAAVPIYNGVSYYTGQGYSFASALSAIPLLDFDGVPVGAGEYVEFTEIVEVEDVDSLTYSVTTSHPDNVKVRINSDGQVVVTPTGKGAGEAEVIVTATDIHGGTATQTFTVTTPGRIFQQTIDGETIDVRLSNGGRFLMLPASMDPGADWDLTLFDTTGRSDLLVTVTGGDGLVEFNSITANSRIGKIRGEGIVLTGDAVFPNSIRVLKTAQVAGPSMINIGMGPNPKLLLGEVVDLELIVTGHIRQLRVDNWVDNDANDAVIAESIGTLRSADGLDAAVLLSGAETGNTLGRAILSGSPGSGAWNIFGPIGRLLLGSAPTGWELLAFSRIGFVEIANDFSADWVAERIVEMHVLGDVTNGTITLTQDFHPRRKSLALLNVRGGIIDSEIRSPAHIGRVVADEMFDSILFAGIDDALDTLPTVPGDFVNAAKINNITLRNNDTQETTFRDSLVAASRVKNAQLRFVDPVSDGAMEFGIAAQSLSRWRWNLDDVAVQIESANQLNNQVFDDDFIARLV